MKVFCAKICKKKHLDSRPPVKSWKPKSPKIPIGYFYLKNVGSDVVPQIVDLLPYYFPYDIFEGWCAADAPASRHESDGGGVESAAGRTGRRGRGRKGSERGGASVHGGGTRAPSSAGTHHLTDGRLA